MGYWTLSPTSQTTETLVPSSLGSPNRPGVLCYDSPDKDRRRFPAPTTQREAVLGTPGLQYRSEECDVFQVCHACHTTHNGTLLVQVPDALFRWKTMPQEVAYTLESNSIGWHSFFIETPAKPLQAVKQHRCTISVCLSAGYTQKKILPRYA